jgi:LemA protein
MTLSYVLPGVAGLVLIWAILAYQRLAKARRRVDDASSALDAQLELRHDLVPKLVESVKEHAADDRAILARVVETRFQAESSLEPSEALRAEARLTAALASLRARAEHYPDLRREDDFHLLRAQLDEIEDEIQAARRVYNAGVETYNARVRGLATVPIARAMSFRPRETFEIELPAEPATPQVAF